jgi:hypothetical protein
MKRHNPAKRHIGFESAAESAAESSGESLEAGKAMIAASTREAKKGPAGKANPRLKRVKG